MQSLVFTAAVERLIDLALEEDIGSGDITTNFLVDPEARSRGAVVAKEPLVVAGLAVAQKVFRRLDPEIETGFMTPSERETFVSASLVKEIALLGGDVTEFVHPVVKAALMGKIG